MNELAIAIRDSIQRELASLIEGITVEVDVYYHTITVRDTRRQARSCNVRICLPFSWKRCFYSEEGSKAWSPPCCAILEEA